MVPSWRMFPSQAHGGILPQDTTRCVPSRSISRHHPLPTQAMATSPLRLVSYLSVCHVSKSSQNYPLHLILASLIVSYHPTTFQVSHDLFPSIISDSGHWYFISPAYFCEDVYPLHLFCRPTMRLHYNVLCFARLQLLCPDSQTSRKVVVPFSEH